MKKIILILLGIIGLQLSLMAQDTLVRKSGEKIIVKVIKITPNEIEYKRFDNQEGPLIIILKSEATSIHYANGTREIFEEFDNHQNPEASTPIYALPHNIEPKLSNSQLYQKGRQDALMHYKGNGAMWGTFGATMFHPLGGLVTGIIIAAVPPKPRPVTSDPKLLTEPIYVNAYQKQAHKRKVGKVASGLGFGVGGFLITVLILSSLSQ